MKAIGQDEYGSSEVLKLLEVEKPSPKDDEVLVRVRAASINSLDWHFMTGIPYFMRLIIGLRRPRQKIRGADLAGEVEGVGKDVTRFKPGDEVYGEGTGTFAEYVSTSEGKLSLKPASMSFEEAASLPVAAVTALQGIRDHGQVQSGQKVLVNGATGGLGTFAVQIAKALGAEVTAVARTDKVEMVRSIGADRVIDYATEDFTRTGDKYDVLFDGVANRSLRDCRRALTPKGTMVLSGGTGSNLLGPIGTIIRAKLLSPFVGQSFPQFVGNVTSEYLADLEKLIEDGKLKPVIYKTYPLEETAQGMRHMEDRSVQGKIVITV